MNDTNPSQDKTEENSKPEESLAERSARLEAEAQKIYKRQQTLEEALEEEDGDDHDAGESLGPEDTVQSMLGEEESAQTHIRIEQLESELNATKEKMMRIAADAENTKRRALRERDDAGKYAISGFARDLLSVADNLRRALDAVPDDLKEDVRVQNLTDGIEATERELLRSFEKNKIEKVNPIDQIFDPNFHEVMFEAPVPGKEPGTIIEVIETGYILHGRILRPARVGVAKNIGETPGEQPNDGATQPGSNLDTEA